MFIYEFSSRWGVDLSLPGIYNLSFQRAGYVACFHVGSVLSILCMGRLYSALSANHMFSLYHVYISNFGFVDRILILIVAVPGHCLPFTGIS